MNLVKTYIAPSKIEGLGMFADEFIPKGALIWRVSGLDHVLTEDELFKKEMSLTQLNHFYKYSYKHRGEFIYCSDENKYCNHSDNANTMSDYKTQVAILDINKGEEITCNYKDFVEGFEGYNK